MDNNKYAGKLSEVGPVPVRAVPKSVHFHEAFCKMWGRDACIKLSGHGPAPAYDSVYIMAKAIEKAGGLDPDAIVSAIEETDMMGAVGRIRFTNFLLSKPYVPREGLSEARASLKSDLMGSFQSPQRIRGEECPHPFVG